MTVGAGAVAAILLTEGRFTFQDLPFTGPSTAAPPPMKALPPLAPLPGNAPVYAGGAPIQYEEPPPKPPPGTWEAVPLAPRPASLGAVGGQVMAGLSELQEDISRCFDEDMQARYGQVKVSRMRDTQAGDPDAQPMLVLLLESRPGGVVIVDAPVQVQGSASDGVIACAQAALRGAEFPIPEGHTGSGKARMVFPLLP